MLAAVFNSLLRRSLMRAWPILAAALLLPPCAYAQSAQNAQGAQNAQVRKPCGDLKSEIAAKLDAKGVTSYTLDIVPKDQDAEGKIVGTCDGGTKKIMYRRNVGPPPAAPAKEPKKP
jgi:hypothetical protein